LAGSDLKRDFFISRNGADRDWATWVAWELEEEGYTTILQDWDFLPGENFILRMNQAAQQSDHTIAILSQSYLDAEYTQPEWAAAFANGSLIPVRVRECELQGLLRPIIYIDLVGLGEQPARENLLDSIRQVLAGAAGERIKKKPDFPGADTRSVAVHPKFPGPTTEWWQTLIKILLRWRLPAAAGVLLFAVLAFMMRPWGEPDCGDIQTTNCLKLDLATGASQEKCFKDGKAELTTADISHLRNLSGQAILPRPAQVNNCPCEWREGTNNSAIKSFSGSNCLFSFELPDGVEIILLNLSVRGRTKVFTINVRDKRGG
jgi:hypothetical protein